MENNNYSSLDRFFCGKRTLAGGVISESAPVDLVEKIFNDELKSPINNRLDKELKEIQRTVGKEVLDWVEKRLDEPSVARHLDLVGSSGREELKKKLRNKAMMYIVGILSVK